VEMKPLLTTTNEQSGLWRGTLTFFNNPVYTGAASNVENSAPLGGLVAPGLVEPNPQQNILSYVSDLFVFYSGGVDFTFIPYTTGQTGLHVKATYYPGLSDDIDRVPLQQISNGSYGSLASHMTVSGQQRALQVTAPFTSNYNQLALLTDFGTVYDEEVYTSGVVLLEITASSTEGMLPSPSPTTNPLVLVEVYKTLADDGRFSWLTAPGREWTLHPAT
jgi:hypothetical protein